MKIKILQIFFFLAVFFVSPNFTKAAPLPVLNFSDIITGPKTGNTDGAGGLLSSEHGAIVTIWGNYLGSSQGTSKVFFKDSLGVSREAAHIYYWKNADGQLPGGPADLYTYHKMQEIAFSIPSASADGMGEISVEVNGVIDSAILPFEVRAGNIRFIKSSGNDTTGNGEWSTPWATINDTVIGGNNKISAGDLVYSVGIGESDGVSIGLNSTISGTAADHISMIAYPNTEVDLSGNSSNLYTVFYNGENPYWNWSKVSMTTVVSGFAVSRYNRIIGVEITGPNVYEGHAGAIGGNCSDTPGCVSPEGGKYFGNYIHNYGTDNGVATLGNSGTTSADYPEQLGTTWDMTQHLYYVSNRSGTPLAAYEIAWNNLIDNPIYKGIFVYDKSTCGDWTDTMKIHHNAIKNQRGAAIDIDFSNCSPRLLVPLEIHDNLIIQNPSVIYAGQAIRIMAPNRAETPAVNNRIYNNTIYGYVATNGFTAGNTEFKNNILVDLSNLDYFDFSPTSSSNNLFFSDDGVDFPTWAGNGSLNSDPLFNNAVNDDFSLSADSPAIFSGADSLISIAPIDFFGQDREAGSVSMGAFQYFPDISPPTAPSGMSVL